MSQMEELLAAARQLGAALSHSEEVQALRDAEAAIAADAEASGVAGRNLSEE